MLLSKICRCIPHISVRIFDACACSACPYAGFRIRAVSPALKAGIRSSQICRGCARLSICMLQWCTRQRRNALSSCAGHTRDEGRGEVGAERWEARSIEGSLRPESVFLEEKLDRKVPAVPGVHGKLHHRLPCKTETQALAQSAESMLAT